MDEQEFDEFYAASFRRVTTQIHALIGDREEAVECVQEAFARAWSHRRKLDRTESPEAWVRTTAHRLAISRWRRRRRDRAAPDRAVGAASATREVDETHVAVVAALAELPRAQREVLVLHHIADLPVHRVAAEVGVPEGTVKARLSRGRAALAALLADDSTGGLSGGVHHA